MNTESAVYSRKLVNMMLAALVVVITPVGGHAAPGELPTAPLFLATGVEPNLCSEAVRVDVDSNVSRIAGH